MFAKAVQIMASQIAEFFCGVIFKAIIERWRSSLGMLSAGKPRVSVHEGITTPQYILKKDSLELPRFKRFHRTRQRLCTYKTR